MKITFVADARSPIARNWIAHFVERGDAVSVISSYRAAGDCLPGARVFSAPSLMSTLSSLATRRRPPAQSALLEPVDSREVQDRPASFSTIRVANHVRCWLEPLAARRSAGTVRRLIGALEPDLVHALRIPWEGMLAAYGVLDGIPLVVSTWGNDLTLYARRTPLMRQGTRATLRRADALLTDCRRDQVLAAAWGFDARKPHCVLPGNGGVRTNRFCPGAPRDPQLARELEIPADAPVIINPRGIRGYLRQDRFFQAIPEVLRRYPDAIFLCIGMRSSPDARRWVRRLGVERSVRLLPVVEPARMVDLFRLAAVSVSPSLHDGTPNTLLEAMASGCFPIAGDLASVREWIEHEVNGLLCDPTRAASIAAAMIRALDSPELRQRAGIRNRELVLARAEYREVMARAADFYQQTLRSVARGGDERCAASPA